MATSAKRYGLEVTNDLELELRLRRIEGEIDKRPVSSDFADSDAVQRVDTIPQVTGLRVKGKTAGAVTVAWNQVRISDLRRYELTIAEDLAFSINVQTFNVAGTEFQFSTVAEEGGGGDTTIFAKVRARNRAGTPGPFSAVLNTETGQAQSADIADGAVTAEKVDPDDPIQFSGLDDADVGAKLALSGFINNLRLSNNSDDSDHDIDIAVGVARDSTNALSISLTSGFLKRIDAPWTAGSGGGGLPSTVTLSADTPYFVFLVSNSSGTSTDAGFDDDPAAVNLLAVTGGFTRFRRIGCVVTDSSSNILPFLQYGDYFQLGDPQQDIDITDPGTSVLTHTLTHIPVGIECLVNCTLNWCPNSDDNWSGVVKYGPAGASFLPAVDFTSFDGRSRGDARSIQHSPQILVTSSGTFKTDASASRVNLHFVVMIHGWTDLRGKDGTA